MSSHSTRMPIHRQRGECVYAQTPCNTISLLSLICNSAQGLLTTQFLLGVGSLYRWTRFRISVALLCLRRLYSHKIEEGFLVPFQIHQPRTLYTVPKLCSCVQVRLQECTFDRNTPVATPPLLAASPNATEHALFYSDSSSPKVCEVNSTAWGTLESTGGVTPPVECEYASTKTLDMAKNDESAANFLTADSEWLLTVMQV